MYTCPLHPEMTTTGYGQCPSCGHDLSAAAETGGKGLCCPMHPQVRQHVPGHCSTCGMELATEESLGY